MNVFTRVPVGGMSNFPGISPVDLSGEDSRGVLETFCQEKASALSPESLEERRRNFSKQTWFHRAFTYAGFSYVESVWRDARVSSFRTMEFESLQRARLFPRSIAGARHRVVRGVCIAKELEAICDLNRADREFLSGETQRLHWLVQKVVFLVQRVVFFVCRVQSSEEAIRREAVSISFDHDCVLQRKLASLARGANATSPRNQFGFPIAETMLQERNVEICVLPRLDQDGFDLTLNFQGTKEVAGSVEVRFEREIQRPGFQTMRCQNFHTPGTSSTAVLRLLVEILVKNPFVSQLELDVRQDLIPTLHNSGLVDRNDPGASPVIASQVAPAGVPSFEEGEEAVSVEVPIKRFVIPNYPPIIRNRTFVTEERTWEELLDNSILRDAAALPRYWGTLPRGNPTEA